MYFVLFKASGNDFKRSELQFFFMQKGKSHITLNPSRRCLTCGAKYTFHTVQRLMYSKGAKKTHKFYHITVILQYCWDKTIARSGDMNSDDSGILRFVIKFFGITNTSVKNFAIPISSVKTVPKCLRKLKVVWTNLI